MEMSTFSINRYIQLLDLVLFSTPTFDARFKLSEISVMNFSEFVAITLVPTEKKISDGERAEA